MKTGRLTVAGSFIVIGLALLMNQWAETNLILQLLPWWPVLLVVLGAEIIFSYQRNEGRIKFDIIGLVLLAVVVVVGGVAVGAQQLAPNLSFTNGLDISFGDDWEERPLEPMTLAVDGHDTLHLDNHNGRINVSSHEGKDVVIEPTLLFDPQSVDQKDVDFDVDTSGDTISVKVKTDRNKGFVFGWNDWRAVQLEVKVPAHFSVVLDSANADIGVRDVDGDVQVDTSNGKIEVNNAGGDVNLRTSNGLIKATQVQGTIEAETSNGLVQIDDAGGDVIAKTVNGKIFIQSPQLSGDWEATTSLGEIEVVFPEVIDASIMAETEIGDTSSDFPLNRSGDDFVGGTSTGTIGKGTHAVHLETSAGSIKIRKLTES